MPANRHDVTSNETTIRNILVPHLKSRLGKVMDPKSPKTVIDLALKDLTSESCNASKEPDDHLIEIVMSHLKLFILAGHDTTAQAMYVLLHLSTTLFSFQGTPVMAVT